MRVLKSNLPLLVISLCICLTGFSSNQKKILILNSYHNGLSWTDSIVNSIKHELLEDPACSIYVEDMDTKRHFSEAYFDFLKRYYHEKYQGMHFDLIISTDNNAYDFLLENRDEVFGQVPVLFCGLNSIIEPPKGYSGVFENLNFQSTIRLIEKNHPGFSEIVVITDHTTTGKTMIHCLEEDVEHMGISLPYRIVQASSIQNLQSELSSLDPKSVVLYLTFNRDSEGKYYTYERGFQEAKPYCKVPIYCIWDFYLDKGAVGGALITGRNQGKQVSEMAKKVLSGTPVDDLPPLLAEFQYVFDHNQLVRFNINQNMLPRNSHIINVPYSFVRENKEIVLLTLTILVLFTIIIIVMTINIHLRKVRAQKEKAYLMEIKASHKKLEKAKEAAEESSRLKSAFLANMSHEIRTPMNAILGFTELLSVDDVDAAKRKRFINIIKKNTNGLLHLINDILDISKIETNQLKIIRNKCNLTELFENLKDNYQILKEQHDNKNLDFKISLPENTSILEITTDTIRLRQIFSNLLENSIKFTYKGEIEVGYLVKDKNLEFFVRDTGIGIPEDKQQIIFDRFRQAELDVNTRQYGGTGLGLAISKSLVELLGGQIWMQSRINEGTTFYFTIPF